MIDKKNFHHYIMVCKTITKISLKTLFVSKYFVFKQSVTGIVHIIANSFVQLYDISFQVPPSTSETY